MAESLTEFAGILGEEEGKEGWEGPQEWEGQDGDMYNPFDSPRKLRLS